MRPYRLASALVLAGLLVGGATSWSAEPTPAEKAVRSAETDPAKVPAAKEAVAAALAEHPTDVGPRLLEARLLFLEAKGKKTAERKTAFAGVLAAIDKASALDPWDVAPFRLKVDVMTAMGTPDQAAYAEALRAIALRLPGDPVAREAYVRQKKGVPQLQAGDPLPRVSWVDANGQTVASESLWSKGPAIIELYRSAVWCPYCRKQLYALHDAADQIAAEGITLVACSPDTTETLTAIAKDGLKEKKPYKVRLLSDPYGKTADKLGFLNPESTKPGTQPESYGLPFPATIIVDGRGIVRYVKIHGDIANRVKPEEMLRVVKKMREEDAAAKPK